MGINLASNFTENAALPLDDRDIFATTTLRDALAAGRRYHGMTVYCQDTNKKYVLQADLTTWTEQYIDQLLSAGSLTSPSYTDNGSGNVTIDACTVSLYSNTSFTGLPESYPLDAITVTLTDQTMNYVVGDYNGGTPILKVITNVLLITESDVVPIYSIFRTGSYLHVQNWDALGLGLSNKIHQSIVKTQRYRRQSGLELSEYGTRNISVLTGIIWCGAVPVTTSTILSATTNFYYLQRTGGNWSLSFVSQYNNTEYSDGTDTQTLTANRYAVNYVYRGIEEQNHAYLVLGTGDYKLNEALASQPPSSLPAVISSHAILVGRIIVEKSAETAYSIESAFNTLFTPSPTTVHNDLAAIDGGAAGEYFHLTNAQHTVAITAASSLADGYLTNDDWISFAAGGASATGLANTVAFYDAATNISSDSSLAWNNVNKKLSIQGKPITLGDVQNLTAVLSYITNGLGYTLQSNEVTATVLGYLVDSVSGKKIYSTVATSVLYTPYVDSLAESGDTGSYLSSGESPLTGFIDGGFSFTFLIFPFVVVNGANIYTTAPVSIQLDDAGTFSDYYYVNLQWADVSADGYRILVISDNYNSFYGTRYIDVSGATTSYVYNIDTSLLFNTQAETFGYVNTYIVDLAWDSLTGADGYELRIPFTNPSTYYDLVATSVTVDGTFAWLPGQVVLPVSGYVSDTVFVDGNVGIKSTAPKCELDITGDIIASGKLSLGGALIDDNDSENNDYSILLKPSISVAKANMATIFISPSLTFDNIVSKYYGLLSTISQTSGATLDISCVKASAVSSANVSGTFIGGEFSVQKAQASTSSTNTIIGGSFSALAYSTYAVSNVISGKFLTNIGGSASTSNVNTAYGLYSELNFRPTGAAGSLLVNVSGIYSRVSLPCQYSTITTLFGIRNVIDFTTYSQATSTISTFVAMFIGAEAGVPTNITTQYGLWCKIGNNVISTHVATTPVMILLGVSGQSADLLQTKNNSGTILSRINSSGYVGVNVDPISHVDVGGSLGMKVTTVTTTTTLTVAHNVVICNSTSALSINLPAASTCTNRVYRIKNINTGAVTIDPSSTETIDGALTYIISIQYFSVDIVSDGSNWFVV